MTIGYERDSSAHTEIRFVWTEGHGPIHPKSRPNHSLVRRSELDSHADTCCGGKDTVILKLTGERVNVKPFSENYETMEDIPVASVGRAYATDWGEAIILVIHEAFYFGDALSHSLWCPNQLRAHGLTVQDTPKQFDNESTHSIQGQPGRNHRRNSGFVNLYSWKQLPTRPKPTILNTM
jgi:hypothetical protein